MVQKEAKEKTVKKENQPKKAKVGSNWESMKKLILRNPAEAKRRRLREDNPEKSVSDKTLVNLEALLNPDGTGTASDTPVVAIDCEMVGVGPAKESALARISIVNFYGAILYDSFVKPPSAVTDYRTQWSGIHPEDLEGDRVATLREAQDIADRLMRNRIVVGHSISNDFEALMMNHPRRLIRDTAYYRPFMYKGPQGRWRPHKLQFLIKRELGVNIQEGEHDSVDDARATLLLYKKYRVEWEKLIKKRESKQRNKAKK